MLQEQQQQQRQTSLTKPPPYPSPQPTTTVSTPRSRRKAQTPRSSVRTESPAIPERSGIPSNSNVLQNMLVQNRTIPESRVPSIGLTIPATVGSAQRWGNEITTTSHGTTAHTLPQFSEPLTLQNVGSGQYSMPTSVCSQMATNSFSPPEQVRARRTDTGSPLPSMVMTTSTVSKSPSNQF
jgi:hypothetical protein